MQATAFSKRPNGISANRAGKREREKQRKERRKNKQTWSEEKALGEDDCCIRILKQPAAAALPLLARRLRTSSSLHMLPPLKCVHDDDKWPLQKLP
jgi:hypothetical protein